MKVVRKRYLPHNFGTSGFNAPGNTVTIAAINHSNMVGIEIGPGSEIDNVMAVTPLGNFVLTRGSPLPLPKGCEVQIQQWGRVIPIIDESVTLGWGAAPMNAPDGAPILELLIHECGDPAPQVGRASSPIVREYTLTGVALAGAVAAYAAFPLFGRRFGTLKIKNLTADTGAVQLAGFTPDALSKLGQGGQVLGYGEGPYQINLGTAETAISASGQVTLTVDSEAHDVILFMARGTGAATLDFNLHWTAED